MKLWRRKGRRQDPVKGGLPWVQAFGKQCDARLKRGKDPQYFGRCGLVSGHYSEMWEDHHALDRGMVNVRWDNHGNIRYEQS